MYCRMFKRNCDTVSEKACNCVCDESCFFCEPDKTISYTKRELWQKLFSENDLALTTAINLCLSDRASSLGDISQKVKDLDSIATSEEIETIFKMFF